MTKMTPILISIRHPYFDGDTRRGLKGWKNKDERKKNMRGKNLSKITYC